MGKSFVEKAAPWVEEVHKEWFKRAIKESGRFGDYLVSWFTKDALQDSEMESERFTDVTEDYVDGYIYALQKHGIAKARPVKQKLR